MKRQLRRQRGLWEGNEGEEGQRPAEAAGGRSSRDPGREMAPSQQLVWPGAPAQGWTLVSTVRSIHPPLPVSSTSSGFPPGRIRPQPCSSALRVQRKCAGLGRECGGPGGRAHGATAALCGPPAHFLAKSRTQLSMAHSTSREPACVFRTCSLCVSPPSLAK